MGLSLSWRVFQGAPLIADICLLFPGVQRREVGSRKRGSAHTGKGTKQVHSQEAANSINFEDVY